MVQAYILIQTEVGSASRVAEEIRQISGVTQAIRNNQDAINYSKTAEGAMDEISRLLRDARSLAVASGNQATLTDAQRALIEAVSAIYLDGSEPLDAAIRAQLRALPEAPEAPKRKPGRPKKED